MTNQEMMVLETTSNDQWVNKFHALNRLMQNPDFQEVIMEGYIYDRSVNGVSMLANEGVKQRGERGDVMEMLVATSVLQDYFKVIRILGGAVVSDLEDEEGPETESEAE